MGAIRDFASKDWVRMAVWGAAVAVLVGVTTVAWFGYQGAVRDAAGKVSACLKGVQWPSNSHDIWADIEHAKDTAESSDSCKKIIETVARNRHFHQLERVPHYVGKLPH